MHRFFPVKSLEDRGLLSFRDAPARVSHINFPVHFPILNGHMDAATSRRVLHRIVQQIEQGLGSPAAIMGNGQPLWAIHGQLNTFFLHWSQNPVDGVHQSFLY